jgi:hypothetical protein
MPAVEKNQSRILKTGYHIPNPNVSNTAFEERMQILRDPQKLPPMQSLTELWQVIKDVVKETRNADNADESATGSSGSESARK